MKIQFTRVLAAFTLCAGLQQAAAQGTAFTYQGQLQNNGSPANGSYNLTFALFNTNTSGAAIVGPVTNNAVGVTNGLFTVMIDFGPGAFIGATNWLQIGVATNGTNAFTPLSPRQQLTPTPYAIYSANAGTAASASVVAATNVSGALGLGQLPSAVLTNSETGVNLAGTFSGNGGGLTNLAAWQLGGNTGTTNGNFLGTTDNQPLEIRVGSVRAGWISPSNGGPNIVFGPAQNSISSATAGASILGGNINNIGTSSSYSVIGGGQQNNITNNAAYSVIGGGNFNSIQSGANDSFLGGGYDNFINPGAAYSVLPGGEQNNLLASVSFLGGGYNNFIYSGASWSVLVGGHQNAISSGASESVIVGGAGNYIDINAGWTFIGGGGGNTDNGSGLYNTLVGGAGNNTFSTAHAFLGGGGFNNIVNGQYSTLVGGGQNVIQNPFYAFLGGGFLNTNNGNYAFLGGGEYNTASGILATLGGGYSNTVSGLDATVPGGSNNVAGGAYSFAAGANALATNSGAFVWADAEGTAFGSTRTNQFNVRANGGVRLVTSGAGLTVDGQPVLAGPNVLTNNEPAVALGSLTLGGNLNLPAVATIYSGGVTLLRLDSGANLFAGGDAGNLITSGSENTAIGEIAMAHNANGSYNTALGAGALLENTNGFYNTACGVDALLANTSGFNNTADGVGALGVNTTGSNNVAIGVYALGNSTNDSGLVAVGYQALQNDASGGGLISIGSANTAVGYQSLLADNSGSGNTGLGYQTLWVNNTGYNNTALGAFALAGNTTATGNIGIGFLAGAYLTTGNNNIDIGSEGTSGDSGVIRIGTPGTQTSTYLSGNVGINGGLNIDQSGTYGSNNGSVSSSALTFGTGPGGSGEGIASQRTSGPNQFDLALYTGFNPRVTVLGSGNVGIGVTNPGALLEVGGNAIIDNNLSVASISSSGPITCCSITIAGGCDLAEPFSISTSEQPVSEGAVVVIDEANPGQLKLTDQPYDTRVAGVVSGANGIHPGIQMHQQGLLEGGKNVALTGRVYVQADTSNGAIKPGDLLTTSRTPGHAMKVTDHARAAGAILGKAMTGLKEGRGMVLVLVTLQ